MEEEESNERIQQLGFKPQREIIYNKLLPYADKLDEESNKLFIDIKTNLAKAVLAREMRPGCMVWTTRLNKYMKIFGLKFSKEDHIALVKLYYELVTIPHLEPNRLYKFSTTLLFLLKKKLLTPKDIQLDWRPLYDIYVRLTEKSKVNIGMYKFTISLENTIGFMIRACRLYFPIEATQEILDEFRPRLCPHSNKENLYTTIEYLQEFLPIVCPPEKKHLGYELWLDEIMYFWEVCHNSTTCDNQMMWLIAYLSSYNIGLIDWNRHIPLMFVRFKRALHLPVSYRDRQPRNQFKIDISAMVVWIVWGLGGKNDLMFFHLEKLMQTLDSYYNLANVGKWTSKIQDLLKKLSYHFVERIYIERYKKKTWEYNIPENFKLTDNDIERFINLMKPCIEQAMFSRQGTSEVAHAMQYLASLRPDLICPIALDKLYASMDSLTEPHKLTSSMSCIVYVARFMVKGSENKYPEGATNVFPLLSALLPGIDPNDIGKCLTTFNLMTHFFNLAPLVNSVEASKYYKLTKEEEIVCEASSGLEDFVLQFFDRICAWVESNSLDFVRSEEGDNEHKNKLESILEIGLHSMISALLYQCSPEIYSAALKKINNFTKNRILEPKISGKLVAILCACFSKTNPKEALKLFIPDLCDTIEKLLGDDEDVIKEEKLNDELLYNLLILSEMLDGHSELINYMDRITKILDRILHMTSIGGGRMAARMLNLIMTSLSFIQPLEYRSCAKPFSTPISELFTVREWAEPGDIKNLNIHWYIPEEREINAVQQLLNKYLIPELEVFEKYVKGEMILERKDLRQRLRIVSAILGCQSVLPQWEEPVIEFVNSVLPPWAFELVIGESKKVTMPDGRNVRKVIADVLHDLQRKVIEVDEGDTVSICFIIYTYNILIFNKFRGRDFQMHWKHFHVMKKILEDRLHQSKSHLRSTLIDRVMLQHEFRNESRTCYFTATHKQILLDIYELCISRYSDVRIIAQKKLFAIVSTFSYSYQVLLPRIKDTLQLDTSEHHEQFKGCLYVLLGTKNAAIITRHDWNLINEIWPLLVKSKPSEKPSIVNLMNALTEAVRNFPTITINIEIPDRCLLAAYNFVQSTPKVSLDSFQAVIDAGSNKLIVESQKRVVIYNEAINALLQVCLTGNLQWRYYLMTISFMRDMVHRDVKYNPEVVKFFLKALINESHEIRKIALKVFLFILVQNKPKYKKITIDPHSFKNSNGKQSLDNEWLFYNSQTTPKTNQEWDKPRYLHCNDFGFYAWPKNLKIYAPSYDQPNFDFRFNNLSQQEKEIIDFFNEANVEILIKYYSMEEKNEKDKFNILRYLVFKSLFKIFEDRFLYLFIPHLQRLVKDKEEHLHKCATEIVAGLIRGSKHWSFEKIEKMWATLLPVIRTAFSNISEYTYGNWGSCFLIAMKGRDPNRHHWLLEFLMDNPLGESTSFHSSSRLFILHNTLSQQPWRNAELINRFLECLKPHLAHSFQNVRQKISFCLGRIFYDDLRFSKEASTNLPVVGDFFKYVMPKMNRLYEITLDSMGKSKEINQVEATSQKLQLITLNNTEEKDELCRLFKTISMYITSSVSVLNYAVVPQYYQILPLTCILQSNDIDEELSSNCSNLLAMLAFTIVLEPYVPAALDAITEVANSPVWSARGVIAEFIPVFVFHNFATIISHEEWVLKIQDIVLLLLEDVQPEVRVIAGKTLSGFLHCHFLPNPQNLLSNFKVKSRFKLKSKDKKANNNINNQAIRIRHSAVLGLCAFVSSKPYDVPDYLSDIFFELGNHLNDPQPIPATIHQTLRDFKRTHHDNWEVHKLQFTEDELCLLSDLTVPPSYYA